MTSSQDGRPFFQVQPLDAVLARVEALGPLPSEPLGLREVLGRILAQDVRAPHDLPGFDRSTVDGYAVRARDTFGATESLPAYLKLVGEVRMGDAPGFEVTTGACGRIGTGGMIPRGADAVVMVEHTRLVDAHTVEVGRAVAPGANVLGHADDAAAGEVILAAGHRVRPQDVGLLASLGHTEVEVVRRPRVAILSTGDEVVPPDAEVRLGQVRDVNGPMLEALVTAIGGEALRLGHVPDDLEALAAAVRRGCAEADVLLVSGGSSVGVRDLTIQVFEQVAGAELWVHGVAVKPGKPFIWVQAGQQPLLGLPGQVTSCFVSFHLLVAPLLERLQGRAPRPFPGFGRVRARLDRNVSAAPGRALVARVRLSRSSDGALVAEPVPGRSGLLRSLVRADGFVWVPLGAEGKEKGETVEVLLFPGARAPESAPKGMASPDGGVARVDSSGSRVLRGHHEAD